MKILAYRGKSIISKLIRWQTRSVYSHIAIELENGKVVEAWRKGVTCSPSISTCHTKGTEVDVFAVDGEYSEQQIKYFLSAQVGLKYDFRGIVRFLSRRDHPLDDRWFCSELVFKACVEGGLLLLKRIPASHVSPGDLVLSPLLKYIETRRT